MIEAEARRYLGRRISASEPFDALLQYPRYFEIETVNACNARCPMCTIDEWQRHTPTMKMPLFTKIADDIGARAGVVKRVSLYRDGEPLLDKKMADRIAMLKERGIRETSIATNVSLLDESKARALLEAGLDHIIFSIDSLKAEVFERIRVRLSFDDVLENALRFIQLRDEIRPDCRVWVRMIRQQSNEDEWPAYQEFWQARLQPSDRVYFHDIFNWGGQLEGYQALRPTDETQKPCVALWSLMVIFANGDVPLCNVDFNNRYPTGDVRDSNIAALWRSHVMASRRRTHISGNKADISLCADCNVWQEHLDTPDATMPLRAVGG